MSTLTTIQSSDLITNSRTNINDNFSALNTDKMETSVLDTDTALTANSDAKVATQKAVKAYVDAGGNVNASTTAKGIVEEATQAEVNAGTAVGATGARLFMNPSTKQMSHSYDFSYLPITGGAIRAMYGDSIFGPGWTGSTFTLALTTYRPQVRLVTSDWADADNHGPSFVLLGNYFYFSLKDTATAPDTQRIYRYEKTNIAGGGTLMTFSGAVTLAQTDSEVIMTSDGTYMYFSHQAGNSANSYVISKYSISGTEFVYVGDVTLGAAAITSFAVKADGNFFGLQASGVVAKYNSSGTQQYTTTISSSTTALANYSDSLYVKTQNTNSYTFLYLD